MEHEVAAHAAGVIFGLNPMYVATGIMIGAYAFIVTERINSSVVALIGASLMILMGVLNQEMAIEGIDFNTLFLLIGMMIIVGITKQSGVFQYVAILAAKSVRGYPRALLAVMSLITAVLSGLLDNVTTVMLIVPVVLLLTEQLKLNPYPFLFAQIFASNVGGTATLIGDPPNILIGSALGFSFMDFVYNSGPAVLFIMAFLLLFFDFIWGRKMKTSLKAIAHLLRYKPAEAITDKGLLIKSMAVLALTLAGFILGHPLGYETGTVALAGGALLMLLTIYDLKPGEQNKKVHHFFHEVEWDSIFFFLGLFVIVAGVENTGLLAILGQKLMSVTGGDMEVTGYVILWSSAVVSSVLNNIPFVATMIPIIQSTADSMGGADAIEPLWWCLVLGACLGGNGSIVGASANVMVATYSERAGQRIPFMKFMVLAFPVMLMTVAIAWAYVWIVYF
jgi:Na+/H+ antiporter NhaD/arsenite permease-like protein